MNFPTSEQHPNDPEDLPPARRRRSQRLLVPLDIDERAEFLDELAHRASPSFDFFLLSLIAGLILSLGLLLDTPAFLILGAALAPLMAPAIGISLGTITGSARLFLRSLAGLLIGCLIVFLAGWAGGTYGQPYMSETQYLAHLHAQISWPNFIVLAVGAILTTIALVHSGGSSGRIITTLPSVALAYELYIPLVVAGFGLGSGVPHLWPDGLVVFALHLSWSVLLGALTLALMGFRPLTLFGYTLGGAVTLLGLILLIGLFGAGAVMGTGMGLPTPTSTLTPTLTASPTVTSTPVPPTATLTPTLTPTLTFTPTSTFTLTPTPVLAVIRTDITEGARIRAEPDGETIGFLANGALVIVLPETRDSNGVAWVYVRTQDGKIGWIVRSLLAQVTATPPP
jgi:Domain of unknown function (DUF389)/Bacterial SH3 domain